MQDTGIHANFSDLCGILSDLKLSKRQIPISRSGLQKDTEIRFSKNISRLTTTNPNSEPKFKIPRHLFTAANQKSVKTVAIVVYIMDVAS
jgi:hypothetical protein